MERILDFRGLSNYYGGPLGPEDLQLFYYDIGLDNESNLKNGYQWNGDVENYLKNNNTVIDTASREEIPSDFVDNQILFTMCDKDEDNKVVALFRHLRNAFSHYRIGYSCDCFCMEDYKDNKKSHLTMRGKIDRKIFKGLMELFFEQKKKIEDEIYKYTNPETE